MTGRATTLAVVTIAIMMIATEEPAQAPRFVWNVSASAPTGLYQVQLAPQLTVATLVVAYLPEPLATWLAEAAISRMACRSIRLPE